MAHRLHGLWVKKMISITNSCIPSRDRVLVDEVAASLQRLFAMRLSLYPFLPEDIVSSLDQIGIRTDFDLLFSSTAIDIVRRLPPGTISIQDLKHFTAQIIEESSALGVRGDALLALERAKQEQQLDFASGVTDLDALLNGFGGSRIFEVSGEKASGKTVS